MPPWSTKVTANLKSYNIQSKNIQCKNIQSRKTQNQILSAAIDKIKFLLFKKTVYGSFR